MAPFFATAASVLFGTVQAASDLARGWGKNIKWVSLKEGQKLAKEQNKPAMIVIHKTWCRACKALKPRFAASSEIAKMSNDFIMINVEDDEEPRNSEFKPDGGYIPRILFMDASGKVIPEQVNPNSTQWKYFYGETQSIVESMRRVSKLTSDLRPKRPVPPRGFSPKTGRNY